MAHVTKLDNDKTLINWNRLGFIPFFFLWLRLELIKLLIGHLSVIANANICGSAIVGNGITFRTHFQENIQAHHRLHDRYCDGRLIVLTYRWSVIERCSSDRNV